MFKTLSTKTKFWIFLFLGSLVIAGGVFVFINKGSLLKGAIPEADISLIQNLVGKSSVTDEGLSKDATGIVTLPAGTPPQEMTKTPSDIINIGGSPPSQPAFNGDISWTRNSNKITQANTFVSIGTLNITSREVTNFFVKTAKFFLDATQLNNINPSSISLRLKRTTADQDVIGTQTFDSNGAARIPRTDYLQYPINVPTNSTATTIDIQLAVSQLPRTQTKIKMKKNIHIILQRGTDMIVDIQQPDSGFEEIIIEPQNAATDAISTTLNVGYAEGNPAAGDIQKGAVDTTVFKFRLTPTRSVNLRYVTLKPTGTIPCSKVSDLKLFIDNSEKTTKFKGADSYMFTINEDLTAAKDFTVKASLAQDVETGQNLKIKLDAVETNPQISISGLPLGSNVFTIPQPAGSSSQTVNPDIARLNEQIAQLQRDLEQARSQRSASESSAIQQRITALQQMILAESAQRMNAAATQPQAPAQTPAQTRTQTRTTAQTTSRTTQTRTTSRSAPSLEDTRTQFEEEERVRQTQPATQTRTTTVSARGSAEPDETETEAGETQITTLRSTPRMQRIPESSGSGPEVLVYLSALGLSGLAYMSFRARRGTH